MDSTLQSLQTVFSVGLRKLGTISSSHVLFPIVSGPNWPLLQDDPLLLLGTNYLVEDAHLRETMQ